MNKKFMALYIGFLLSSIVLLATCTISLVEANPSPKYILAEFRSPQNITYPMNNIPLVIHLNETWSIDFPYYPEEVLANYSLDGRLTGVNVTIPRTGVKALESGYSCFFDFNSVLPALSNGSHRLELNIGNIVVEAAEFTVNASIPTVRVVSPQEKLYRATEVPLEFTVDKPSLAFSYSLDDQPAVIITGNSTLNELTEGAHRLRIYANDTEGNTGYSYTIFSVYPQSTPEQSPSSPLVTPSAASYATTSSTLTPTPLHSLTTAPSPTVPEMTPLALLALAVIVCVVAAVLKRRLRFVG
jgi:hypothetical protein